MSPVEPPAGGATRAGDGSSDSPAWSPDGRYVAFVSDRDGGDAELYLMRADGTAATRLTRSSGADWLPRWIPSRGATGGEPPAACGRAGAAD